MKVGVHVGGNLLERDCLKIGPEHQQRGFLALCQKPKFVLAVKFLAPYNMLSVLTP